MHRKAPCCAYPKAVRQFFFGIPWGGAAARLTAGVGSPAGAADTGETVDRAAATASAAVARKVRPSLLTTSLLCSRRASRAAPD